MTDSAKTVILQALATFGEIHNRKVSTELIKIWLNLFESKDAQKLRKAFSEHLDRSPHFPKPAEINSLLKGSNASRALAAWTSVVKAMGDHGSYQSVRFEDPHIVPILTSLGGWQYLCELSTFDLVWSGKDFNERYQDALSTGRTYSGDAYLPGTFELGNTSYDDSLAVRFVTIDGRTPPPSIALPAPQPAERIAQGIDAVLTDKGAHVHGKGKA